MTVTLKPGAQCRCPAPAGFRLLRTIDLAAELLEIPLTISSGDEGEWRDPTDPHRTGEAYDVSVAGLTPTAIVRVYRSLRSQLPSTQFTVLFECPTAPTEPELIPIAYINAKATGRHFHLQRKKGTVWPPSPRLAPGEVRA